MSNDNQPLLAQLQARIDDDKEFAWAVQNVGGVSPEEFRLECRKIFADLFDTAGGHWYDLVDPLENRWEPRFSGAAIVEHYGPLHSCWLGNFSEAIMNVAEGSGTTQGDRAFLYFMLGILRCGWHEHLRQLSRQHADRVGASAGQ